MINWKKLLDVLGSDTVSNFAKGDISWNKFEAKARFTEVAGSVRSLLRNGGVDRARKLARKALQRRGINE